MRSLREMLFGERKPFRAVDAKRTPRERTWYFEASDTRTERARKLAEIAFADFANDRFGMIDKAAFRIAQVMEKYEIADAEAARTEREKQG